ncbi:hypothetical protein DPSP01_014258 [Paraphaeosphaeria sporulosa]
MSTPNKVFSYHVNVMAGDATIHLRVQDNGIGATGGRYTVRNAVLIDAGHTIYRHHQSTLWDTIRHIQSNADFNLTATGGLLKFDAVVITHWHQDHYKGLYKLLLSEIDPDAIRDAYSFFHYGPKVNGKFTPETILYAPRWGAKKTFIVGEPEKKRTVINGRPFWLPMTKDRRSNSGTLHFAPKRFVKYSNILRCKYGDLRGIDFFTGVVATAPAGSPPLPNWGEVPNPAVLMASVPQGVPRLMCVASAGWAMGTRFIIPNLVEDEIKPAVGAPEIVDSTGNSKTNHDSIVAMVMWNTGSGNIRISHYLGGDADWTIEAALVRWANVSVNRIDAVKLSHHGSQTSSPTSLFRLLRPMRIVASAGFSYGHPSYPLLLWLSAFYADIRNFPGTTTPIRPFYPTNYPYYFALNSTAPVPKYPFPLLEIGSMTDVLFNGSDTSPSSRFRQEIANVFHEIKYRSPNIDITRFLDWKNAGSDLKLKKIAAQKFATIICIQFWNNISPLDLASRPSTWPTYCLRGGTITWPTVDTNRVGILYHRVEQSPTPATEPIPVLTQMSVPLSSSSSSSSSSSVFPINLEDLQQDKPLSPLDVKPRVGSAFSRLFSLNPGAAHRLAAEVQPLYKTGTAFDDEGNDDTQDDAKFPSHFNPAPLQNGIAGRIAPTPASGDFSFWSCVTNPPPGTVGILVKDSSLDSIVSGLDSGMISLASAPTTAGVAFAQDDEMTSWFSQMFTGCSLTGYGSSSVLDQISIQMGFATGHLQYSTNYFSVAMGTGSAPILPVPPQPMQGIITNNLIMGLSSVTAQDEKPPFTLTFLNLIGELYRESPNDVPAGMLLLEGLELEIDVSEGSRNAIWFSPVSRYNTVHRSQFVVKSSFPSKLAGVLQVKVADGSMIVITKKEFEYLTNGDDNTTNGSATIKRSLAFVSNSVAIPGAPPNSALTFVMEANQNTYEIMLTYPGTERLNPGYILDWLVTIISDGSFTSPVFADLLRSSAIPGFRRIKLVLDSAHDIVQTVELDLDWQLDFGSSENDPTVSVLLTYKWTRLSANQSTNSLRAALWYPTQPLSMLPASMTPGMVSSYESYEDLQVLDPHAATDMSLKYLLPGNASGLPNMPAAIANARILSAAFEIDSTSFSFEGAIAFAPNDTKQKERVLNAMRQAGSSVPPITFDMLYLNADYMFASGGTGGNVDLALAFQLTLNPSAQLLADGFLPGYLYGAIEYSDKPGITNSSTWTITGSADNIWIVTLYSFFDSDISDSVMSVLKQIFIPSLSLEYIYSGGVGSEFDFTGSIMIDIFELDFDYHYFKGGDGKYTWTFEATLSDNDPGSDTTLDAILGDLTDSALSLPDLVGNIVVPFSKAILTLKLQRTLNKDQKPVIFSVFELEIDEFALSFVHFADTSNPNDVTRLVVASLSKLPGADIPIVGALEKPFDELYFLYVDSSAGGLTQDQVDMFNANVDKTVLVPKPLKQKSDIVIQGGYHFTVIVNENNKTIAIIDYIFDHPEDNPQPDPSTAQDDFRSASAYVVPRRVGDDESEDNPPAKAPMEVHLGPITISSIGLQFTAGFLGIMLDVSVMLGPIELALLGLTLGIELTSDVTLANLPGSFTVKIDGVGVAFNKPPVVMAGTFEYRNPMYIGGIAVTMDPYVFKACGEYGVISVGNSSFKTVSLFADLVGPLIELEFAEVTTIVGGFGYNSALAFPTAATVPNFPFFDPNVLGGDPLQTMEKLSASPWIAPKEGEYWLAAGLTVNALQLMSMEAVVVIEFDPSVKLGLFADCVSQVPTEGDFKLMWVQMLIAAVVDFGAGTMAIDGVLSPQSFILDPDCHLGGGFALYYWFGSNLHAGDFVFTIGGYHPAYTPEPYYPNPPRLSISWNMDDGSSITGTAYFAITPRACMVGGSLNYTMSCGPLSAFFDAWADLLINFKPFYYMGDVGMDVGVRFTLDLWIVTIHISCDINAYLYIEGPPTHGYVHVDFWVFGFDIYFGSNPSPTLPVTMDRFYNLLHQDPKPSNNDHVLNVETGMYTDPTDTTVTVPEIHEWLVHANTFSFSIGCVAAISEIEVAGEPKTSNLPPVYGFPMHLALPLVSPLSISITEDAEPDKPKSFGVIQRVKQVPMAVWAQYNDQLDPSNQSLSNPNQIGDLLDGTKKALMPAVMGLTLTAPPPTISKDKLLNFNVNDRNSELLHPRPFPKTDNEAQRNWLPDGKTRTIEEQYAAVESAWMTPGLGADTSQKAADLWAQTYGWAPKKSNKPPPPPAPETSASVSKALHARILSKVASVPATAPRNLVQSLPQFYLAPPLITVG